MPHEPILYCATATPPIIGRNFKCGREVLIDGHAQVTIGDDVFVGHHVLILTGSHDYEQRGLARQRAIRARPVTIGDGAWICSGAILCPGVTVGADAVVGPGAVVMANVPRATIVGGNPARRIRRLTR